MTRRDALIRVIEALHRELAAPKSNGVVALAAIEDVASLGTGPAGPDLRELADEANRLNETCRIYVNLMAANVRRKLQTLTGDAGGGYRPMMRAYA